MALPELHAGQRKLLDLKARFRVGICGRRFGKTLSAMSEAVRVCESGDKKCVWWISPVLEQSRRVERELTEWLTPATEPKKSEWEYSRSQRAMTHKEQRSRIEFHSAEQGDRLRGAGLDLAILDEAADIPEAIWNGVVKPMLLERRGLALILGTPRGTSNWLHKLYRLAEEQPGEPYGAVRLPSRENPRVPQEDLELFRADMTENEFRQEFEAEFVDGVDAVFKNVLKCVRGPKLEFGMPGFCYVHGVDLANENDFTAIASVRRGRGDKEPLYLEGFDRFNGLTWRGQIQRIVEHTRRFPGPLLVDATGLGKPVVEALRGVIGWGVYEHSFNALNKVDVIQGLALALEQESLVLPDERVLVGELQSYRQLGWSASRSIPKFGAPEGLHDDCVIATGLALLGVKKGLSGMLGNPWVAGFFG